MMLYVQQFQFLEPALTTKVIICYEYVHDEITTFSYGANVDAKVKQTKLQPWRATLDAGWSERRLYIPYDHNATYTRCTIVVHPKSECET